ncbi:BTB/POZ protein [Rhizophagus clarus]|nr:BTB/POZ protein [Rhizophagus clarus]
MDEVKKNLRKRVRGNNEMPQEPSAKSNETNDGECEDYKTITNSSPKPYTRGDSLTVDLANMINNPLYSDLVIRCKDDEELHANKLFLAGRSEYFNDLLFQQQQTKESSHLPNKIIVPDVTSPIVKIVLEFLYTGKVSDKTLTIDIVSDIYNGASVFVLPKLKEIIIQFMKSYMKHRHNVGSSNQIAKILSEISNSASNDDDDQLIEEICKFLMSKSLYKIDYHNLSSKALEYLLSRTLNMKEGNFFTTEYDVLRYCILWAVDQIEVNDVLYFSLLLPSNGDLEGQKVNELDPIDPNNQLLQQHQHKIKTILNSILNFIDFRLIHASILAKLIEPLDIVKPSTITDAYRYQAQCADGLVQMKRGSQE